MKKFPPFTYLKVLLVVIALNFVSIINASAQLSGIYFIDNTANADNRHYKSFTAAANDLNGITRGDGGPNNGTLGTGGVSGNVTFNVKAGEIFTEPPVIITYSNPNQYDIIFRKDPNTPGVNPVLKGTGGSNSLAFQSPPTTIPADPILEINAGDAYTIDGIDLTAANNTVEMGLLLYSSSGTHGCSNNTVQNCTITMDTTGNDVTYCIMSSRPLNVPTVYTGASSNNIFNNNTLQNATNGIYISGGNFTDQNNQVINNTILRLNNKPTATGQQVGSLTGIFLNIQENAVVDNNTVKDIYISADGGGQVVPHVNAGIIVNNNVGKDAVISNNTVKNIHTAANAAVGEIDGIKCSTFDANIFGNTITNISADNNTIAANNVSGTILYGINAGPTTNSGYNIYNNTITVLSSAGNKVYGIQGSPTTTSLSNIYNNTISNIIGHMQTSTGSTTAWIIGGSGYIHDNTISGPITFTVAANNFILAGVAPMANSLNYAANNKVSGLSLTTTGTNGKVYGIYSNGTLENITGNTIGDIAGAGTIEVDGIFTSNMLVNEGVYGNIFNGAITASSGIVYGMKLTGTTSTPVPYIYNNIFSGSITGTGTTDASGIWIASGGLVYNNTVGGTINASSGIVSGIEGTASGVSIYGNTIGSVNGTGTATEADGILITSATASAIYGNTINGVTLTSSNNANVLVNGIKNPSAVAVYNNSISNMSLTYTGTGTPTVSGILAIASQIYGNTITGLTTNAGNVYGINATATASSGNTQNIFSNTISTVSSSAGTGSVIGINAPLNTTVTTVNIMNNNISGISCTNTSATTTVTGLNFSNATTSTNTTNINNNVISTVRTLSTTATGQVTGLLVGTGGATGTHTYNVFRNKIFTISTASAGTGTAVGLQYAPSSSATVTQIYDNMIYDVNADNSSASTLGGGAVGLYVSSVLGSGSPKVYFNTIYLSGAGPGAATTTTQVSTAFYCASGIVLDLENNIFANATTVNAGASSFIYAFWYAASAVPNTASSNLLYAGTSAGGTASGKYYLYNQNGTLSQTLANYKTTMAAKADGTKAQTITVALSSFFVSAVSPINVHIFNTSTDAFGKGTATATAPDFDGDTHASPPSIGADEVTTCASTIVQPASFTPAAICAGSTTATYTATSGTPNVNYNWSFTPNSGITIASGWNTSAITANIPANLPAGTYGVTVTASNGCTATSAARTASITVNGVNGAGTISATNGGTTICRGTTGWTYTTTAVPGATSYTWALSSTMFGTISSGQGSQTITVSSVFGSGPSQSYAQGGNVTVIANTSACTPVSGPTASFAVTTLPSPLAAPATPTSTNKGGAVCQGQTGLIYSVPNTTPVTLGLPTAAGTDYVWTVPSGATIVGATNKNRIVVNYSGSASSGNVSVVLKSLGGTCSSASSGSFAVTVSPAFSLNGVTQTAPVCAGTSATINISGLLTSRTFTAHYTIAGGPTQSVSITSDGSGQASFALTLASVNNGQLLEITDLTDATGTTYFTTNNSVSLSVISPPSAPVAGAGTNIGDNQFTAHWGSVTGATGYFLDVATDNAFSNLVSGYSNLSVGLVTSYNVTALSAGSTYYYRVRAAGGSCASTSPNSNTISVNTTGCPPVAGGNVTPITSVICSGGSQVLTNVGSTGGTLQWQVSTDNLHWANIGGATNATYTATPAQKSYYRLQTISTLCYTVSSNTAIVDISATPVVTITNVGSTAVTVTWSPYGSGQYNITWSGAAGSGSAPGVTTNIFTITGLTPNQDLLITVTPGSPTCSGVNATSKNTHTLCASPTITNVSATPSRGFKVNWTTVTGATAYRVFYRDLGTSSSWSFVDTAGTKKTINVLYGGHTFAVYVAAKDCPSPGNIGDPSSFGYITTNPVSACGPVPTVSATSSCPNQIHVDITGSTPPYNLIMRRIAPGITAGASYPISTNSVNITVGTQYAGATFEVFATKNCGAGGISITSNVFDITVKPGCPTLTNVVVSHPTCSGFTVSWNADDCAGLGISGYQLLIKKNGTPNFNGYPVGTSAHAVIGFLPSNTTFDVEVMSVSCNGASSALSSPDTITTLFCGRVEEAQENAGSGSAANEKESVTVYPNPTQGQFWVDLNRSDNSEGMVKIELLNQLGQVIQTNISAVTLGHLNQLINTPEGLASGIYFVRTTAGGNVYVSRLMITKE